MFRSTRLVRPVEVVLSLLLVLGALAHTVQASWYQHRLLRDFLTLDAGAACMRQGCSPYDVHALDRTVVERGHAPLTDWLLQLPIYPPTSIALYLPFTFLSVAGASFAMWLLILLVDMLVGWACFVRGDLLAGVPPLVRAVLFALLLTAAEARFALGLGNPIALAMPLLLFCCLDDAPSRRNLRAVLFAIACLLKPQIGLPFALPLLVKPVDGWRTLARSVAVLVAFSGAVLLWCAFHPALATWLPDLRRELALGAAGGNSMNPSSRNTVLDALLNMEYLVGYFVTAPATRGLVATAASGVLGLGVVAGAWRILQRRTTLGYLLLLAATAAWTLMPVYHRFYDNILLLLVLPWAALALQARVQIAAAGIALLGYGEGLVQWFHRSPRLLELGSAERARSVGDFFLHRLDAFSTVVLCVVLIAALLTAPTLPQSTDTSS